MNVCEDCNYPYEGEACGNPACVTVNPEAHARHLAEAEKRRAEQDKRNRLRAWAERSGYSSL